ncbi:MAG: hypothetical protein RBU23_12570 [Candidatus Auribacterota bacterium]|jgi:hypothetical protein|nr:hypothetical protein [Candidatus Auribacterota bacterium]
MKRKKNDENELQMEFSISAYESDKPVPVAPEDQPSGLNTHGHIQSNNMATVSIERKEACPGIHSEYTSDSYRTGVAGNKITVTYLDHPSGGMDGNIDARKLIGRALEQWNYMETTNDNNIGER